MIDYHLDNSFSMMNNVWEIWKPHHAVASIAPVWNYILFIPYVFVVALFIRICDHGRVESFVILCFTLVFMFAIPSAQYREPVMWLLILSVIRDYKAEAL